MVIEPIFSIIVPVYNTAEYLEKCFNSIVNQTLKTIEIIVVDDGSTDSSLDTCNRFAAKHNNFRVYTKKNEGQGVARNYGLERACGKYVCFVDSDDWIEPELCSDMQKALEISSADFANFGLDFVTYSGKITKKFDRFVVSELHDKEIFYRAMLDDQILSSPVNKVYRRQFLNDHDVRFPPLLANEDIYFSRAVSRVASKTIFVSKVYYHALIRSGSTTRNMSIANFESTEVLINFERTKFPNKEKDQLLENRFRAHVAKLLSYLLIQAAFRINCYSEYIACFNVAQRCGFFECASSRKAMGMLKIKNRLMIRFCVSPLILRLAARLLKTLRIQPY